MKYKLKTLRKKAGLTQVQLAKQANISRSYLADLENGRYNPSLTILKKIAIELKVPLTDIIENGSDQEMLPLMYKNSSLELTDFESFEKCHFSIDGKELNLKELKGVIAFVRAFREVGE